MTTSKLAAILASLAFAAISARAQQYAADQKPLGATAQNTPEYLKHAGIDQNLNHPLPLADHFRDEAGNDTPLGAYFGKRPVDAGSRLLQMQNALPAGPSRHGHLAQADRLPSGTRIRHRRSQHRPHRHARRRSRGQAGIPRQNGSSPTDQAQQAFTSSPAHKLQSTTSPPLPDSTTSASPAPTA